MMNVVITGGNRGIGLALAKQYKDSGAKVYVTCRNSSDELNTLGVNIITGVDVSQPETLGDRLASLLDVEIDLLINNAGVLSSLYGNIGIVYRYQGHIDLALEYGEKGLELAKDSKVLHKIEDAAYKLEKI